MSFKGRRWNRYEEMGKELNNNHDLVHGTHVQEFALGEVWNSDRDAFAPEHFLKALANMRQGAAPGNDGITAEGVVAAPLGYNKSLFTALSCRAKDPHRIKNTPKFGKMKL